MSNPSLDDGLTGPDVDSLQGRPAPALIAPADYHKYGAGLLAVAVLLLVGLLAALRLVDCTTCPPGVDANGDPAEVAGPCISYFGLAILSALSGAGGAAIHSLTSFALFAGKRKLALEWMWWIYLRIPVGTLLAMLVLFAMVSNVIGTYDPTKPESIHLVVLMSGLAGLFSKQVSQKLSDVLNFVFGLKESEKADEDRDRPDSGPPAAGAGGAAAVPGARPVAGPDQTVQRVQDRLIKLGYLDALRADGRRFDDGELGPVTRAAIERYLEAESLVGEDRALTLGEEGDPEYWTHLLALLDDSLARGATATPEDAATTA